MQSYLPLPCAWLRKSATLCPSPLLLRDSERQGRGFSTLAVEHLERARTIALEKD